MYRLLSLLALCISSLLLGINLIKLSYRKKELIIIFTVAIPTFLIGARLLNYVLNFSNYQQNNIPLWTWRYVGFSIYGGIILTSVSLFFVLKLMKKDMWEFIDALWLPFGVAFIILRIGCYSNGCCYGKPTDVFWGMMLQKDTVSPIVFKGLIGISKASIKIHPTQLYELFGVVIVLLLVSSYRRINHRKGDILPSGITGLLFGIGFTLVRLLVLPLRDLPYPPWIQHYAYPLFYISIISVAFIVVRLRFLKR